MELESNRSLINFKTVFTRNGLKETARKILHLKLASWKIAFSIGLGIFIGLSIPMGLQTIVAIPLALMFQCNLVLTATATMITNPLTVIPLYYTSFKIGGFLTGMSISENQIQILLNNPTFENITHLGSETLIQFFTGAVTQGIFFGLLTYFLSLIAVNYYRRHKNIGIDSLH